MDTQQCNYRATDFHLYVPLLASPSCRSTYQLLQLLFPVAFLLIIISAIQRPLTSSTYAADSAFIETLPFGTGEDDTQTLAVGDMNNDGYLDIVVGNANWVAPKLNYVYLNDRRGGFFPSASFGRANDNTTSIALGDLNDDGYLDIVVGNGTGSTPQQNYVYLYEKERGTYSEKLLGAGPDFTHSVVVGDVDGNGTLDVVVNNGPHYDSQTQTIVPGQIVLYKNEGDGTFAIGSVLGKGIESSIALGDMDHNGSVDIVIGTLNLGTLYPPDHPGFIYFNSNGQFSDSNRAQFGAPDLDLSDIEVGDINKDGYLDVIATEGSFGSHIFVYLNDPQNPSSFYSGQLDCNAPPDAVICFETEWYLTGIALADVNRDDNLDVIAGISSDNSGSTIYLNDGNAPKPEFHNIVQFGTANNSLRSLVAGDMDNDGDLDMIVGYAGTQNLIYLNSGLWDFGVVNIFARNLVGKKNVMVGDLNSDHYLDIVVCNETGISYAYLNNKQGGFSSKELNIGSSATNNNYLILGDMNNDTYLDIVVGNNNGALNGIYFNNGQGEFTTEATFGRIEDNTQSIALGDLNGDGYLDIVVGNGAGANNPQMNYIYLYDRRSAVYREVALGVTPDSTKSLAVGDIDHDGDLDIVVGNEGIDRVYLNDGWGDFLVGPTFGSDPDNTTKVALGDMDGDGYLDIVVGNNGGVNRVYFNDRKGNFTEIRSFGPGSEQTLDMTLGDIDGDKDLDIVVANKGPSVVYLNDGKGNFGSGLDFGATFGRWTFGVALGDLEGDGDPDIIAINYDQPDIVFKNGQIGSELLTNAPYHVSMIRPGPTQNADFYSTPVILGETDPVIPISYTLHGPEGGYVGLIRGYYSLDGGGHWAEAIPDASTQVRDLATNQEYVFGWHTSRSEFFGQSDNVVFRIEAYPSVRPHLNAIAGPYQYAYVSAQTFPFRARGTQIRVFRNAIGQDTGIADALVYSQPPKQERDAQPIGGPARPFHTSADGYLQGRDILTATYHLVALQPVTLTRSLPISPTDVTLAYRTSATPTISGLQAFTVTAASIQPLVVPAAPNDHPLLLFNLNVALEWDASKDGQYQLQLESNLKRASELLYDWTNGQAALGQVRVFNDAPHQPLKDNFQPWLDAHVRIYASNQIRPSATQGGVISDTLSERATFIDPTGIQLTNVITYVAGQVRIGAVWNRYGETTGNLGDDWARALAHELGHYLLFLDDNYLGYAVRNEGGQQRKVLTIIPADLTQNKESPCPGAMNDPYREVHSEFNPGGVNVWSGSGCRNTLSNWQTGRADWQTIVTFFPNLHEPPDNTPISSVLSGPNVLPLAVTQVDFQKVVTPTTALDVPIFYLFRKEGGTYIPGRNARAILFQGDRLVDLGQPVLDQVQAYGARPGDHLCVYELANARLGCEEIKAGNDELQLDYVPDWQPEIIVSPVTSRTINVRITIPMTAATHITDNQLRVRLFPVTDPASESKTPVLISTTATTKVFSVTLNFQEPALEGYVQVWVEGSAQLHEVVADYAMGGNPAHLRSRRAHLRSRRAHLRSRRAPALSSDGQVIVFGEGLEYEDQEWILTLQAATTIPGVPPGRTVVGQAYWLVATDNAPNLTNTDPAKPTWISFGYLGDNVPSGEEQFVRIYYRDANPTACQPRRAPCWHPLKTELDTEYNVASAPTQGRGLYALMSSMEVPLAGAGWNMFAYPVQYPQTVPTALASIEGVYSVVWGYNPHAADPWQVYSPQVAGTIFAPLVNDLEQLEFGHGYWVYITATEDLTLYLKGTQEEAVKASTYNATLPPPPATYYGTVLPSTDFMPEPNMPVTTWVAGKLCGQSQTHEIGGQIVYAIDVTADTEDVNTGCGASGRTVTFKVNGVPMVTSAIWDNADVWNISLAHQFANQFFLPLVTLNSLSNADKSDVLEENSVNNRVFLPSINQ